MLLTPYRWLGVSLRGMRAVACAVSAAMLLASVGGCCHRFCLFQRGCKDKHEHGLMLHGEGDAAHLERGDAAGPYPRFHPVPTRPVFAPVSTSAAHSPTPEPLPPPASASPVPTITAPAAPTLSPPPTTSPPKPLPEKAPPRDAAPADSTDEEVTAKKATSSERIEEQTSRGWTARR